MATTKKTTSKAAVNKATTTKKTVAKKPATVKKAAPAKKQVDEPVVEEKPKMSWKKKLAIVGGAVAAVVGGIALHGHSKYNEGCADQAAVDIDKFSNQPVDVSVNLITDKQMAFDEPDAVEEVAEEQIEEI